MASKYLIKYYNDNNPVLTRLTIIKKILIRLICFIVSSFIFIIFRIVNKNNIFNDISKTLLTGIYIVMGISILISLAGIIFIILLLVNKSIIKSIPFEIKKKVFIMLDWLLVLPICICVALFCYGYLFRIQTVSGNSMEPNLYDKERVVTIYANNLKRGDVVICRIDKEHFVVSEDSYYVKRIIGIPGDSITWDKDGLILNGEHIDEKYLSEYTGVGTIFNGEFVFKKTGTSYGKKVPEGYVFVMGDNRGVSQDSRSIGLVPIENITGVVIAHIDGIKFKGFVKRGVLA